MVRQSYTLLCPCVCDLQHYSQLPIRLLVCVLFYFLIQNSKQVKSVKRLAVAL